MTDRKPIGVTVPYRAVFPKKDYKLPKDWVGLTDEYLEELMMNYGYDADDEGMKEMLRDIEAKLKEKNT